MNMVTIGIFILIYISIGVLLSFAVYDGGKHCKSIILFYPAAIFFICILTGILLISDCFTRE